MKYIFVLGLQHSGTTLTDYLLSKLPNSLGLVEIASYFNPEHMHAYMKKWGSYDDVRLCSCRKDWSECEFWSEIEILCGLKSNADLDQKYRMLFKHLLGQYPQETLIIELF